MKKLLPLLPAALGALATGLIYLAFAGLPSNRDTRPLAMLSNSAIFPGLVLTFIGAKLWAAPRGMVKQDMRLFRPRASALQPLIPGFHTPKPAEEVTTPQKPKFLRYLLPGASLLALAVLAAFLAVR